MNQPTTPTALLIPYRILKVLAILVGGPLTILSLMSLLGTVIDNGWIRLGLALLVGVGAPLFVTDRLLPEGEPQKGKGIPSEVFAIGWLSFAILYAGVLTPFTGPLLSQEGTRLEESGMDAIGVSVQWIAGPSGLAPATAPEDPEPADAGPEPEDAAMGDAGALSDGSMDGSMEADAGTLVTLPPSAPMTPAEIFRQWAPSVVSVQTNRGSGTGFLIGSDGTVVTNHHVIADAGTIRVKFMNGTWATEVWLLADEEERDLALLQVAASTMMPPAVMSNSEEVTVGEQAVSIGNPLGLEHTLTEGIISARRIFDGKRFIQTSAPVSPGNSGGPLFNAMGEVVGVTTLVIGGFGRAQNLNLAVPINDVKLLIQPSYPDRKRVGGGEGSGTGSW